MIGTNSKHSTTNENGNKLVEFALEHDLQIRSTIFERKDIHKGTWVSPDGMICNQIDHVAVERRHANLIKDVKSRRGACRGTDHFLVKVTMNTTDPKKTLKIARKKLRDIM